jgi:hypothetical protein
MPAATPDERFRSGYDVDANGCWIWKGCAVGSYGYGSLRVNGKPMYAHRYSWALHRGPIPEGMCVCHKCDVAKCVNPGHLFLGSHADNMADRNAKGRAVGGLKNPMRGTDHPRNKLTEQQVLAIRADTGSQRDVASRHDVSRRTIRNIQNRTIWKHIT